MAKVAKKSVETTSPVQDNNKLYSSEFENLIAKIEEHGNRGYSKDSVVTIPGALFAEFLHTVNYIKETLIVVNKAVDLINQSTKAVDTTSENLMDATAALTIKLMKAHLVNIESGSTTDFQELDKEDATEKIQEIKD